MPLFTVPVAAAPPTWERSTTQKGLCHPLAHLCAPTAPVQPGGRGLLRSLSKLGPRFRVQVPPDLGQLADPPSHLIGCQCEVLQGPQVPEMKQV